MTHALLRGVGLVFSSHFLAAFSAFRPNIPKNPKSKDGNPGSCSLYSGKQLVMWTLLRSTTLDHCCRCDAQVTPTGDIAMNSGVCACRHLKVQQDQLGQVCGTELHACDLRAVYPE